MTWTHRQKQVFSTAHHCKDQGLRSVCNADVPPRGQTGVEKVASFFPWFIKTGESGTENFSCTSTGDYGRKKEDLSVVG